MVAPTVGGVKQLEKTKEENSRIPIPDQFQETGTLVPQTCPMLETKNNFYTRYFPVDRDDITLRVRLPILGLCATLLFMHYFILTVGYGMGWNYRQYVLIPYFAYFVLATGAALELWWGLKTSNMKNVNMWALLKAFEVIASVYAFLYYIYDQNPHLEVLLLVYSFPIMVINAWVICAVLQSTRVMRNTRNLAESCPRVVQVSTIDTYVNKY